jgi:hypothetical protein
MQKELFKGNLKAIFQVLSEGTKETHTIIKISG